MALLTEDQRILAPALNGAQTLWTGRPLPGIRFRVSDWGQILTGVFVLCFFAFWEFTVLNSNAPGAFPIFGLVVFAIALWQTLGQFAWAAHLRGRTYYALTQDGFAIIYTSGLGGSTKRIYLPALPDIGLELRNDGSGTITFGHAETPPWWARSRSWTQPRPPAFEFIADPSTVYDLCAQLQRGKAS